MGARRRLDTDSFSAQASRQRESTSPSPSPSYTQTIRGGDSSRRDSSTRASIQHRPSSTASPSNTTLDLEDSSDQGAHGDSNVPDTSSAHRGPSTTAPLSADIDHLGSTTSRSSVVAGPSGSQHGTRQTPLTEPQHLPFTTTATSSTTAAPVSDTDIPNKSTSSNTPNTTMHGDTEGWDFLRTSPPRRPKTFDGGSHNTLDTHPWAHRPPAGASAPHSPSESSEHSHSSQDKTTPDDANPGLSPTKTTGQTSPVRRRTRVLMTRLQSDALNQLWNKTVFPSTSERDALAQQIGLTSRQVQVWFQNQRQKRRRERENDESAGQQGVHGSPYEGPDWRQQPPQHHQHHQQQQQQGWSPVPSVGNIRPPHPPSAYPVPHNRASPSEQIPHPQQAFLAAAHGHGMGLSLIMPHDTSPRHGRAPPAIRPGYDHQHRGGGIHNPGPHQSLHETNEGDNVGFGKPGASSAPWEERPSHEARHDNEFSGVRERPNTQARAHPPPRVDGSPTWPYPNSSHSRSPPSRSVLFATSAPSSSAQHGNPGAEVTRATAQRILLSSRHSYDEGRVAQSGEVVYSERLGISRVPRSEPTRSRRLPSMSETMGRASQLPPSLSAIVLSEDQNIEGSLSTLPPLKPRRDGFIEGRDKMSSPVDSAYKQSSPSHVEERRHSGSDSSTGPKPMSLAELLN